LPFSGFFDFHGAHDGCKRSGEEASRFVVQGERSIGYAGFTGINDRIPLGTPIKFRSYRFPVAPFLLAVIKM
jgi:hypothetical protein